MIELEVTGGEDGRYTVVIHEDDRTTSHVVRMTEDALQHYGGGAGPEDLLEASFEFLLERQPKERILSSFDLPALEERFPEYTDEMRWRLD